MFELAENLKVDMLEMGNKKPERFYIGVSEEVSRPFAAEFVSCLIKTQVKDLNPIINMKSDKHMPLLECLRDNTIDVAISNHFSADSEYELLAEIKMPVVLIFSPKILPKNFFKNSKLTEIKKVLNSLPHQWVLPTPQQRLRYEIDLFMEKYQAGGSPIFESDVLATSIRAIEDGIGFTFIPRPYVKSEIEMDKIHSWGPEEGLWKHKICLISRHDKKNDPLVKSMKESFMEVMDAKLNSKKH
jgi:DNA-binding transcriptional LysR family regulator